MLSRRTPLSLVATGLGCTVVALGGCQSASSRSPRLIANDGSSFKVSMAAVSEADFAQRHQFYFYPIAGIYRDCDQDRWLWSENAGLTWNSGAALPAQFEPGNEVPFAVFLTLNDPTTEHQAIAAAYPRDGDLGPAIATVQGSNDLDR